MAADALGALEETRAVLRGHFRLSSGLHSDTYVQCARLMQFPRVAEGLARELAGRWRDAGIQVVAAPALGGILVGYELARALAARSIFLEREGGAFALRRGQELSPGEAVLCAEDVVTTGGSVLEAAGVVEGLGGRVAGFTSLIDRSRGALPFRAPYRALLKLDPPQYRPEACPLCAAGKPLDTPGSRHLGAPRA